MPGFIGLVAIASPVAEAKPTVQTAGTTIFMGGGLFGLPGTITADATLPLFVISSSITVTDGYGVTNASSSLAKNYINLEANKANSLLAPLAAGQTYSGEQDPNTLNGTGPFLFTLDYTVNPPPQQIDSTGTFTITYREGSSTAPLQTTDPIPFRTALTPEPGAITLFASGLVGSSLFLLRRKRKPVA